MKYLLVALAVLFGINSADAAVCQGQNLPTAPGVALLCSKTFYGAGTCNGQDQIPILQYPWESSAITIRSVNITLFQPPSGGTQYTFSGNSYTPDIMLMLGANIYQGSHTFQSGTGMPFPAIGAAGLPHVDLHIGCSVGSYQLYYIIDYTVP